MFCTFRIYKTLLQVNRRQELSPQHYRYLSLEPGTFLIYYIYFLKDLIDNVNAVNEERPRLQLDDEFFSFLYPL